MKKIKFEDLPSENTPINSANLDTLQNNIEESAVIVSSTEPQTKEKVWFQKGKNIFNFKEFLSAIGGISLPYTQTISGVTFTIQTDGGIKVSGTASANIQHYLYGGYFSTAVGYRIKNLKGTIASGGAVSWDKGFQILAMNYNGSVRKQVVFDGQKQLDFDYLDVTGFSFNLKSGTTVNTTYYLQIENGNVATSYEAPMANRILTKTNGTFEEFYNEENTENYSLGEQKIGIWIDGKPLYQKTIDFGALPNTSEKKVNHGITNLGNVIGSFAVTKTKAGANFILPFTSTIPSASIYYFISNTQIVIGTGSDRTSFVETYVTIKYTKATD